MSLDASRLSKGRTVEHRVHYRIALHRVDAVSREKAAVASDRTSDQIHNHDVHELIAARPSRLGDMEAALALDLGPPWMPAGPLGKLAGVPLACCRLGRCT